MKYVAGKKNRQSWMEKMSHLDVNKLKKLFVIGIVVMVILVIISQKKVPKSSGDLKDDKDVITKTVNLNRSTSLEGVDYNHLTAEELNYFKEMYGDTAAYTEHGIEVYMEKAFTGRLRKIITSEWPTDTIADLIPKPSFGKIQKIEYAPSFIHVFLKETKEGNVSEYVKLLKKQDWKEKEKKEDGDVFLQRILQNKDNDKVKIKFYKNEKRMEIYASKQGG